MKIAEFLQLVSLLLVVIGFGITIWQLRANRNQKAAEFIINLNNQFFQNEKITKMYYQIEYNNFEYTLDFHGSDEELQLDNLIKHFDNLAKIYKLNNFDLDDLGYFAYHYLVVFQNDGVKEYLEFLDNWYKKRGIRIKPFKDFREVGKLIESEYYHQSLDKRFTGKVKFLKYPSTRK